MTKTMAILSFLANSGLACHDCFKLVKIMNVTNLLICNRLTKMVIFESEVRNVGYMDITTMLRGHGMVCSMSGKGECLDNAVAERFFGSLKVCFRSASVNLAFP